MKPNSYIRIICEGLVTEPNYFRGMLLDFGHKGGGIPKSKDNSPSGIVKTAKLEYKKAIKAGIPKNDIYVWVVFDRDGHANLKNAIQDAQANGINVAFSSVCFEYFVLLHFEKCTRPFENCDAIIGYLKRNYSRDYTKKGDHYANLKDLLQTAIDNNHWLINQHLKYENTDGVNIVDRNPYTNVFALVKALTGLKDPVERAQDED